MALTLSQLESKVNALEELTAQIQEALNYKVALKLQLDQMSLMLQNQISISQTDITTLKASVKTLQDIVSG